jgi:fatty-acyl-CoA synthase
MYPGTFAATAPDKPAAILAGTDEVLTYGQLEDRSVRLARALYERGIRPGDTVAMLTDNQLTAFEIYWAAMRSGVYLTAINHHLSAEEVAYILTDSESKAVIVSATKAELAVATAELTPGVKLRLAFGGGVDGVDGGVDGHESYDDVLAATSPEPLQRQPRGSDMLYSSGTTGRPKGIRAPLPDRQVDEPGDPYVALFVPHFGLGPDSVYLSPAPIYHAAPLRFSATVQAVGGTVVMMRKFDAEGALAAIRDEHVTHLQMVPTMFVRMLKLPEEVRLSYDVSSLKLAIHAAAPCPPDVKRAMIDWWGPILVEYYASTEGNGGTLISSADWLRKPGSVGRAFMGVVHICDDAGEELPAGDVGLVYFERDELPFTYHNDPERTADAQNPLHPTWTTVGDVGYLDDEGFLFLTDRKSFMIISGGVNIYPQEIENALALHPLVEDVAVIGIPDEEMGQSVKAFVVLASGTAGDDATAAELTTFLRSRIAGFKLPRSWAFVEELPRTETGKLAKHRLPQT